MDECASTYTINRRTGEKLTCEKHLCGGLFSTYHAAEYAGTTWYWSEREADA